MGGIIYTNNKEYLYQTESFVYLVELYRYNPFELVKKEYYRCDKLINNFIASRWINQHLEVCTELWGCPKWWLDENGYIEYKFEKKKKK